MEVIVFQKTNNFSNIILQKMLAEGILKLDSKEGDLEFYCYPKRTCYAITVPNFLNITNEDVAKIEQHLKENCSFLIIATHKSETQKQNTISIHHCGNYVDNLFGGNPKSFSQTSSKIFFSLYNLITTTDLKDLQFFVEVTHHGPTIDRPLVFFEIGPNDSAYYNKDYQNIFLDFLKKHLKTLNSKPKTLNRYILIGAPHYLDQKMIEDIKQKFSIKYKENVENFCLTHIMPKYVQQDLFALEDKEIETILSRMIDCTETGNIIINKDYTKSVTRLQNILENLKKEKKGKEINYFSI